MLCEKCNKNEAIIHLKSLVNGKQHEMRLCGTCAAQIIPVPDNESDAADFDALFAGLGQWLTGHSAKPQTAGETKKCPLCGATPNDIASKGRAGCVECYNFFAPLLSPVIRRIHGNAVHTGSIPASAGTQLKLKRRLDELKTQLQIAIAAQEYEKAACLRDEIRDLESNPA